MGIIWNNHSSYPYIYTVYISIYDAYSRDTMRYPMVIQRSWRPYASTWNAAPVSWDGNGTKTGPCYANVIGKIWEWSCRMVLDHQIWENMGETYFQTNPTLSEPCVWSSYRQNEASYVYMSIPSLSICASTCNHTKTTIMIGIKTA